MECLTPQTDLMLFSIQRMMGFNWMAALALKLDSETLGKVARNILGPLAREMNTADESNGTLRQVAKEAAGYVKRKIGADLYNTIMLEQMDRLDARRAERKKQRAQLVSCVNLTSIRTINFITLEKKPIREGSLLFTPLEFTSLIFITASFGVDLL